MMDGVDPEFADGHPATRVSCARASRVERTYRRCTIPAALVVALVLTGLAPLTSSPILAVSPDTVVIGMAQEPDTLLGPFTPMGAAREVLFSLFVDLVEFDEKLKPRPRRLEKVPTLRDGDWELLPGKKMRVTYRFKRGYTWHDGRPVTALDTSWTYLMLRNPRTPTLTRFVLNKIDNMHVPNPNDPYTLVVQWNELFPFANLGHDTQPRHVLEREYARDPAGLKAHRQARAPIGNGPYRFVEWVPGSHIALEAYENFVEGRARVQRQVFRFILDSTILQANVIAGQVDVSTINNFSLDQMIDIERRSSQVLTHYVPQFGWEYIDLNLDNEWLRDKRVRHAIAHAINREELNTRLFYGKQPVAHTWLAPLHEAFNPHVKQYAYDPTRARSLLADAGFVPGADGILRDSSGRRVEITIMTTTGNAVREQVQPIMREQMRAVGIDLKIDNRPASVLVGPLQRRRQFPHMIMLGKTAGPFNLGFVYWHSSQIPTAGNNWEGFNIPGWRHPENDRLLEQITQELDTSKRIMLLRRQQEIQAEELPSIPLYYLVSKWTSKRTLRNVRPSPNFINVNSELWEWQQ